jgi:hypothetical protein
MQTDQRNTENQSIKDRIKEQEELIALYDQQIDEAFNEGRLFDLQTIASKK